MNNASLAFNVEGAVSGYKEKIAAKNKEVSELHRQLGKRTAKLEWVYGANFTGSWPSPGTEGGQNRTLFYFK